MIDNSSIYERQGKKGLCLQIILRYGKDSKNRKTFTKTIKVSDYHDKKSAYVAARMIRDKARIDISMNKVVENNYPTVDYFYKKHLDLDGLSLKTKQRHNSIYNYSIIEYKDIPLDKIKTADIQKSLIAYAENHSQKQISRLLQLWKAIYHTALILEYEIVDKTVALKPVKSKKVTVKKDTSTDIETFNLFCDALLKYNAIDNKPCKLSLDCWYLLQVMRYTGCRTAEVLALYSNDFDFDRHILHINKSVGSTGSKTRQIITTKTASSVRDVPMTNELENVAKSLIHYSSSKPLLIDSDKKPYEMSKLSTHINYVSKKANIHFNAYMLRHLFSSTLYQAGINQAIIRDLMGHTSSSMTLNYANTTADDRKSAIKHIE